MMTTCRPLVCRMVLVTCALVLCAPMAHAKATTTLESARLQAFALESCENHDLNESETVSVAALPTTWTGSVTAGTNVSVAADLQVTTTKNPDGSLARVRAHGTAAASSQEPCPPPDATRSVGISSAFYYITVDAPTAVHVRITATGAGTNAVRVAVGRDWVYDGPAPVSIERDVIVQPSFQALVLDLQFISWSGSAGPTTNDAVVELTFDRPASTWTWQALPRYGKDDDEDGKIDSFAPDGFEEIEPRDGYEIRLQAAQCPADTGQTLRWTVDGATIADGSPGAVCTFNHLFPAEGDHEVSLDTIVDGEVVASDVQTVAVNDILIVSIGDSVASGEGAPEVLVPGTGWQNEQCHRSAAAGPAVAARLIEDADPHSSVTFVHLACSGADVLGGVLGPYAGIVPGAQLPPQLEEARALAGQREIDVLAISVGANDVRFSEVVKDCFVERDCSKGKVPSTFRRRLKDLVVRYADLGAAIQTAGIPSSRVYLTEYFDALRDETLTPCTNVLEDVADVPGAEISPKEIEWASGVMMPGLNGAGADAAAANGWNRVSGMFADFGPHGYCAADNWITQLGTSLNEQGDENGTLHPNWNGHSQSYGPRLANAIASQLGLDIAPFPVPAVQ